jgi:hypothetical protein
MWHLLVWYIDAKILGAVVFSIFRAEEMNPVQTSTLFLKMCFDIILPSTGLLSVFFLIWFVRLLALWPLLAYCGSLG